MGLLPDTSNCGLRMRRECLGTFSPPPTSRETASAWHTCCSRHSRCMHNPQFYVSGKRPMKLVIVNLGDNLSPVAAFTREVNSRLAKRPLDFNGRLANRRLTSLVNEATDVCQAITCFNDDLSFMKSSWIQRNKIETFQFQIYIIDLSSA